ncbi:integrase arm-type DNA-binding domain-containing protein [Haemophilus parahaemolyticus]|uniref:integrase arm-type DNA-binding domain-containing protein n=1 Tax=Haemophilus parahaemolyticus TaxID=735 RepID=UPI0034C602E3
MTKSLTNTEIEKAKQKKITHYQTGTGFLLVKTSSSKLWWFNYYQPFTKKRVLLGVGKYPDVSLT